MLFKSSVIVAGWVDADLVETAKQNKGRFSEVASLYKIEEGVQPI